jgi:riboflavin biosynthesis pyrimidine reductase
MRRLLPTYADDLDDAALEEEFGYPADRPWVRANMVSSLDGAMSLSGRSSGLSSPADKRLFALLRSLSDVILVGAGTVRTEGYQAVRRSEVRDAIRARHGLSAVPAIAVVSSSLDLDPASPLFVGALEPTVLVTTESAARTRGAAYAGVAEIVTTPGDRVDLARAVDALVERGARRLLCEGGPQLLAQVTAAARLDELCLALSPRLVAGDARRILDGPALGPVETDLTLLVEDSGFLFARYRLV